MKKVISMKKNSLVISGIAASLILLAACGDEITEVNDESRMVSLDKVKEFKDLPECKENVKDSVMYVKDSAKVFICTDNGWTPISGKTVSAFKNDENSAGVKGPDGNPGSNCTATANQDKTGFDITCDGKVVGTIKDGGKGENGEACTLTEGENGQVTIKCGKESVTLFKASCGSGSYDPATQFCANDMKVHPLCHNTLAGLEPYLNPDGTYNVKGYFCDATDILLELCNFKTYDNTTQFCFNRTTILNRCNSVAEGLAETHLNEDDSYDGMNYFCSENGVLYEKCGGKTYNPELEFCDKSEENPQVIAKCGGQTYETKTQMCDDGQVESAIACCIKEGQNDKWCEGHSNSLFDVRKQFCDSRDGQPYKFTAINIKNESGNVIYSETWMAQNLNYAGTGADESACIDCETIGRFYTWPAAMSYCPDGWRLPTMAEFAALNNAVDDGQRMLKLKVNYGWSPAGTDEYGFSLMQSSYMMDVSQTEVKFDGMRAAFFWTSSPRTEQQISRDDAHYVIYNNESYSDNANSVDFGLPVRCIKDHN